MRSGPINAQAITANDGTGRYWYDGNIDRLNKKSEIIEDIKQRRSENTKKDIIKKSSIFIGNLGAGPGAALFAVGVDIAFDVAKTLTNDKYNTYFDAAENIVLGPTALKSGKGVVNTVKKIIK